MGKTAIKARDAMNRRLYNNQSFVETAIYRVFMMYRVFMIIYPIFAIYNCHQPNRIALIPVNPQPASNLIPVQIFHQLATFDHQQS